MRLDTFQRAERDAINARMGDRHRAMRWELQDRKIANKHIANADDERAKRMAKAQAEYDKAVKDADWQYKYDTEYSARHRDAAQRNIDSLLDKPNTPARKLPENKKSCKR